MNPTGTYSTGITPDSTGSVRCSNGNIWIRIRLHWSCSRLHWRYFKQFPCTFIKCGFCCKSMKIWYFCHKMLRYVVREGVKNPRHRKRRFFAQKTPFLGQFLMDFFLTERGGKGTPLPPSTDGRFPKIQRKKLTERGGTPPPPLHGKFPCRGFSLMGCAK